MSYNPFYNIENPELMGYEYAWVNFIKNNLIPENIISNEILNSWKRCKLQNMDAMTRNIPENFCGIEQLEKRLKKNSDLVEISKPIMTGIVNVLNENGVRMVITDSDNHLLMDIGRDKSYVENRIKLLGRSCDEEAIGTNSLDLAIRHKRPMSVLGAEHYYQIFHKYAEYAAPIFGTNNEIKGVIGIIINLEEMGHYVLAMVTAAAKAIENELQLSENRSIIIQQNKEKENILDSVTDGIIYVDKKQIITQANQQITKFTGFKKEELIGKPIGVIQTIPPLSSIFSSINDVQEDIQVKLKGKSRNYNCLLNHKIIRDNHTLESNIIWIFTATEEIQGLAHKINQENRAHFTFDNIIGKSKLLVDAIELAKKAAKHETRVIIEGESGTGKEMFAQSIHNSSFRRNGPFIAVDCGAIPHELLESEIFGYEEGAYTGAKKGGHRGKFELAHKGTLFLDEIGNLPLEMQVKLLRVLQENKVVRIGGYNPIPVDVQIIAATNLNLQNEVENGSFREDLFYRLNIVNIKLPPLRERKEDIPTLVNYFINAYKNHKKIKGIEDDALNILINYNWPGNIRQLNNVVERMMILCEDGMLSKKHIPNDITIEVNNSLFVSFNPNKLDTLDNINRRYIINVVNECKGNIKRASEILGITRATVYKYIKDEIVIQ